MHTVPRKLVTIIADRLWTEEITAKILEFGATGYTVTEAHGQGSRGLRPLDWEGANVRIEVITGPLTADRIIGHIADTYFDRPGFITFVQDIEVIRGDKYV